MSRQEYMTLLGVLVLGSLILSALLQVGIANPTQPTISIENLYIPALNITSNQNHNTTIFFDLKLNNHNRLNSIHYKFVNVTLFYRQNHSFPVANASFPGFHQGFLKKAHRKEMVEAFELPWDSAKTDVMNGTTTFLVNVNTTVKYTVFFWKSRRQKITVNSNLSVNDKGSLVKKHNKGVKLKIVTSSALKNKQHAFASCLFGFVSLLVLI